jgi:hypothetical protein
MKDFYFVDSGAGFPENACGNRNRNYDRSQRKWTSIPSYVGLFLAQLHSLKQKIRAGIVQSVQRLATGWTTKGSGFESRWGQKCSLLHVVQTCSGAHPASYPMGTGGSFPRHKAAEA